MAVVVLLVCGFGIGVLPGSTGLLPVRQVYAAIYDVYDILFPMAVTTEIYASEGVNTSYLPIRAVGNTDVPPTLVGFFLDASVTAFDADNTMPFTGFLPEINDGLDATELHTITATAYEGSTENNSVATGILLSPMPDADANGIPEGGLGNNNPYAVPMPAGGVDHTVYIGVVPSVVPARAYGGVVTFSSVASVDPLAMTPEIVVVGSDTDAFQDVLFEVPPPATPSAEGLALGYRFVVRAAPLPDDIATSLTGLSGLPAESADISYLVAFDGHVIDPLDMEVTAFTDPLAIAVALPDGATALDAMPIFVADTSLDTEYDVVAAGTPFAQLPVSQVVEDNELLFDVDTLSTYVVMLHAAAPVLDSDEIDAVSPGSGPKAGCTPVSIHVYGSVDDPPVVRFGANDATDVLVTPLSITEALISCLTPPGDALGDVDVFVVNSAGTPDEVFAVLEDAFQYVASNPIIADIDPDSGAPGATFTITGSGFAQDVVVTFGYEGAPIVLISVDCDTIVGVVPNVAPGFYDVYVWDQDSGNYDYWTFEVLEDLGRGGSGGPCFIATAAYGTPAADQVETLRTFRDRYLLTNAAGTALMRAYYRFSPAVASVVAGNSLLRALTRAVLTVMVTPLWVKFVLVAMAMGAIAFIRRKVTA
jgi:hypothetical protein